MMVNKTPDIRGLVKHIKDKSEKTQWSVEEALKEMKARSVPINFSSVAKKAEVSKTYLYNHNFFRKEILKLREIPLVMKKEEKKSADSKDILISILRGRIQVLEKEKVLLKIEVKQLNQERQKQLGEIYDFI
ncbi:DUF6262 family protein [Carnobacterium maltaromaticum]|uniref:DUF6262 family protein n=1 Tax=Carnobacterium maltaromaticum TaxID=2751 RepID=UPI00191BB644|nr:DUF6262 family protein [Carnobacterium maltaromaticum]CAD5903107.1 transposase [Carnobacterium maltaromaticum]